MTTQTIFSAVGFLVGSYFGYPQLGLVVGSLVGAALTPKQKVEGPRLDDLRVTSSTYGAGIPVLYGTERMGGNVIWSTDKREVAHTESQGKGGGVESTSYTYVVDMRVLLCETPLDGSQVLLAKIFQDGKLVWDVTSGIPVGSALASAQSPLAGCIVYQGDDSQLPDANEEAWQGGPVPAYRGVVSIAMRNVDCPGNRVPQFSFVLSNGGTYQSETSSLIQVPAVSNSIYHGAIKPTGVWHYTFGDTAGVYEVNFAYGELGPVLPIGKIPLRSLVFPPERPYPVGCTNEPLLLWSYQDSGRRYLDLIDLSQKSRRTLYSDTDHFPGTQSGRAAYSESAGRWVLLSWSGLGTQQPMILNGGSIPLVVTPLASAPVLVGVDTLSCHFICQSGSTLIYERRTLDGEEDVVNMPAVTGPTVTGGMHQFASSFYVNDSGTPYAYIVDAPGNNAWIYKIHLSSAASAGSWELLYHNSNDNTANIFNPVCFTFYCTDDVAIYGPVQAPDNDYKMVQFAALTVADVKVSDIIADQCERVGETRYDVSGIPDSLTVQGYKIATPAAARANMDPLMSAFGIYGVDEDGLIKFKRFEDITSVASVAYDELGAGEVGSNVEPMPLDRMQEIDLPRSVTVSYIEANTDFQTATESEVRYVTEATEDNTIEIPVCISSDQAKKAAQMLLYASWRTQNRRTVSLTRKFAFVSPGDGLTIEYPRGVTSLWRINTLKDDGRVLELGIEPGDASLYGQTATGASGYEGQNVDPLPPLTNMTLLDMPILRDQDDNAGLYVGAEGFSSAWRGYTLWVGDDDASLQDRGTVTTSTPTGFAESALGNWPNKNFTDAQNLVIINMGDGDVLSGITESRMMTTRDNLAVIGADGRWELIQFQNAFHYGDNRYGIWSFMRGLYGTERFINTHQPGDTFVLINQPGMLRPSMSIGEIGSSKRYRPVSIGRSLDSVASQSFTNHAVGLLPYSPWDARKSKAASNDQTVTWQRRTRYSSNSLRGIVPLGEASEHYTIYFYTSSAFTTLAGTLTSTTNSVTITSAQQTSFGLTPGATLHVGISQVSDAVGAGPALFASL